MRKLVIAACLIATICAYHVQKHDYEVVLDGPEFRNVPSTLQGLKWREFPEESLAPLEEVLAKVASDFEKKPFSGTEAILNDYADKIFTNIRNMMIHNGLDPFAMPDLHTGFNYTLIITYHGELDLTKGWLSDISSMHRGGDVVATYSSTDKQLEVTVPIAFDDLQFTYDYSAKIMGLGPTGGVNGKVANVAVEVKIGFNAGTLRASMDEFYITNSGHINLDFNGNPLVDWLLNLLLDVATGLLKPAILLIVENIIRGAIGGIVDAINSIIDAILNPTTPVPTTTIASLIFNNL